MDAWRSPGWVLNDHPEDQFLNFLRRLSSPDGHPDLGDQLPVQTESARVPTNYGFRCDDDESLFPSRSESADSDPDELVEQVQSWPPMPTFQDNRLLTQRQILE